MFAFIAPRSMRSRVEAKLNKLAPRAHTTWAQVDGSTPSLVERQVRVEGTYRTEAQVIECDRFELGDIPAFEGYTFIARIEHTEAGNIVTTAPGQILPKGHNFHTAKPVCAHCGLARARRDTIIMDVGGTLTQIGRNCLAKYMPVSPLAIIAQASLLAWLTDKVFSTGSWGEGRPFIPTADYVACVVASHEEYGFRRTDSEESTRGNASWRLHPCYSRDNAVQAAWESAQPTPTQIERAATVLEWARTLEGSSDYESNLRIAACLNDVRRNAGILASIVQAYDRAHEHAKARCVESKNQSAAGYLGSVKERLEITATLKFKLFVDSAYGGKTLYKFESPQGHQLVWWCCGRALDNIIGDTVVMKATIKAHDEYKGVSQTLLTRCKIVHKVEKAA